MKKIKDIVEMQVYNPDCEQAVALRAQHMHELAVLNGTLKEVDVKCLNCGRFGHKTWQCDERPNFTSAVICTACGGVGHLSKFLVQYAILYLVCQDRKKILFKENYEFY